MPSVISLYLRNRSLSSLQLLTHPPPHPRKKYLNPCFCIVWIYFKDSKKTKKYDNESSAYWVGISRAGHDLKKNKTTYAWTIDRHTKKQRNEKYKNQKKIKKNRFKTGSRKKKIFCVNKNVLKALFERKGEYSPSNDLVGYSWV